MVLTGGNTMALIKKDWVLLLLRRTPLDRIHIMKALFLIWHRSGRKIQDYFKFEPYLYGPCSFEVYAVLDNLQANGRIIQPPHPMPQWVNYYLTEKGGKEVEEVAKKVSPDTLKLIESVVNEVSGVKFYELLKKVYDEAPDFAVNSIFKEVVK
ncbi:MAG: hypothetical protein COT45_03240 [bacterium (Candidatus Stahlbacteria) CG08_land_8_20_14_0_20_40_26]|nr:MAG: hypothetical protein COT45_03240 [bacterium (Candidatus Stahlbacteria) CG08_land_8_20_14_0_20_40_26]